MILRRTFLTGALALIGAVTVVGAATAEDGVAECALEHLDLRGAWGEARFSIELAVTPREQARGLMWRQQLAPDAGMLFVYPKPGQPAFWMKNTLIPLDMLFITPDGRVQHVHTRAIPGDLTPISGGAGVSAVLEIPGGRAAELGITAGDQVRHPAFATENALWPCFGND